MARQDATPRPYYQMVREVVAANVSRGNLPAGTLLQTSALADRLGLSRPPVKRALDLLVEDGVVSALGTQGYVVGRLPPGVAPVRVNLHGLPLELFEALGENLGQASWERIYEAVEQDVMHCIPFGTYQVSEALLGEHFNVSRTVVRDVLSRMDARGLIAKDRSSHWVAGPMGARMLDNAHDVRRLLEPSALVAAMPHLDMEDVAAGRALIDEALAVEKVVPPDLAERVERHLHVTMLAPVRNPLLVETVRLSQISLVINALFRIYIGPHDETAMFREHALIYDHVLVGDGDGAAAACQFHLDADHARARARLKVLSVFDAAETAPYLSRLH